MSIGWIGMNAGGNYIGPKVFIIFGFPKNIANSVLYGFWYVELYKNG